MFSGHSHPQIEAERSLSVQVTMIPEAALRLRVALTIQSILCTSSELIRIFKMLMKYFDFIMKRQRDERGIK